MPAERISRDDGCSLVLRNGGNTYRLAEVVGRGGFGKVYRAVLQETGMQVAVKVLLRNDVDGRFNREARAMLRFQSPYFTRFVDFFEHEIAGQQTLCLVMEFLPGMPGSSLSDVIDEYEEGVGSGLDGVDVLKAFARYARGLTLLHRNGVVHRDIKPANLYFPVGDPRRAVVMDLGIIRDIHGSITSGQFIGTLDYMPPEVFEAGYRAEPGWDVYALGLCLYESLSGHPAYPRLPTGAAAMAELYKRAQTRQLPVFDNPEIVKRPILLDLLMRMTSPTREVRPTADEVVRILASVRWGDTIATRSPWRGVVLPGVCSLVLSAVAVFCWKFDSARARVVAACRAAFPEAVPVAPPVRVPMDAPPVHEPEPAAQQVSPGEDANGVAGSPEPTPRSADMSSDGDLEADFAEALALEGAILTDGAPVESVRDLIGRWRKKGMPAGFVACWSNVFARAAAERKEWLKDRRRQNQLAVERRKRFAEEAERAKRELTARVQTILDPGRPLPDVRREGDLWRAKWQSMGDSLSYRRGCAKIDAAYDRRRVLDFTRVLKKECEDLIADFRNLRTDAVASWRERLRTQVKRVEAAFAAHEIDVCAEMDLRRKLSAVGRWNIGVIANRMLVEIQFVGERIPPMSDRTFAFEGGLPSDAAVSVQSFEPIPVRVEKFDGCLVQVSADSLRRLSGDCKLVVPKLGPGVFCLIDGLPYWNGEIPVKAGSHRCVFRNMRMTYDGERDFLDEVQSVDVVTGQTAVLSAPKFWRESIRFRSAKEAQGLSEKGDRVFDWILGLLNPQPVEDRRVRLDRAKKALADYRSVQMLGTERSQYLSQRFSVERDKAMGYVVNSTDFSLAIDVRGRQLVVPPGAKELVAIEDGVFSDIRIHARGFENLPLPTSFDGGLFDVTPEMLRPHPVSVRLPLCENDVRCFVSGRSVESSPVDLEPGRHVVVYRRRGYAEQRVYFTVRAGDSDIEPVRGPDEWSIAEGESTR